jgi:hypothetical protein
MAAPRPLIPLIAIMGQTERAGVCPLSAAIPLTGRLLAPGISLLVLARALPAMTLVLCFLDKKQA